MTCIAELYGVELDGGAASLKEALERHCLECRIGSAFPRRAWERESKTRN